MGKSKNINVKERKRNDADVEMERGLERMFRGIEKIIEGYFGKRCGDYERGCIVCRTYAIYDKFKKEMKREYLK